MLKPKYIEQLPAAMVELYSEVEQLSLIHI